VRSSENSVKKLSEKSRRCPGRGLIRHPKGIFRPVLAPEYRPNPCSERCSDPFSDSFMKPSEKSHKRAKRLTIRRLIAT
jgi:hypothetical protein